MDEKFRSQAPADTEAIGRELAARLVNGGVVLLMGPLGAGKTLLAKAIFGALGVDPARVTSPTFQLVNRYRSATRQDLEFAHIDLYRTESEADLVSLGLDELLEGPSVVVIEWAERIRVWPQLQPIRVTIDDLGDERRAITVETPEP